MTSSGVCGTCSVGVALGGRTGVEEFVDFSILRGRISKLSEAIAIVCEMKQTNAAYEIGQLGSF